MRKKLLLLLLLACFGLGASAQKAFIKGTVADTSGKQKLQNSSILLIRDKDSVLVKSVRADKEGYFELNNIPKGRYNVIITYPKMADYINTFNLSDSSKIDIGLINMELQSFVLQEVVIRAQKEAIRVKGDTITYQADSFKVAQGANVQELLKRLPGFEIGQDGTIKAQGKDVANVLVDGDEFFGDDPLLATKYLKANAVKEVEVYDKKSKNAELTGIDDGKKEKTVNIKLKDNAKNGYLANLDANTNADNLRDYGGMAGIFKNKLKAAVYGTKSNTGLSSKVNQAVSSLKGGDYDMIQMSDDGSSIMIMGFGGDEDYFNPNSGIPDNLTLGAHLSNKWKDNKRGFKLNYKYTDKGLSNNRTDNGQQKLPDGKVFINSGNAQDNSTKKGNDLKGNFDLTIDSLSTLKFSAGYKDGDNIIRTTSFAETHTDTNLDVSKNTQNNSGTGTNQLFNGNINYTKKFLKKGRTLSVDLQPEYKTNNERVNDLNITQYYDNGALDRTDNLNLLKINSGKQNSIASKISYSEPLSKQITFQGSYSIKNIYSESFKSTFDKNILIGSNPKLVDSLSNNFKFNSLSNVGKGVLQWRIKNLTINGGLEATHTSFDLNDLDRSNQFSRNYLNLAPNSNINFKTGRNSNISFNYNGNTKQPSLNQLQPIREINNPLYQVVGNANLKPSFTNQVSVNFNSYAPKSQQYMFGYIDYNVVNNDIVTTETVDQNNKRTVSYINIDGNKNIGANVYYDRGFSKLHLGVSLRGGVNRSVQNSYLNKVFNKTISNNYNFGTSVRYYTDIVSFSYEGSMTLSNSSSTIGTLFDGKTVTHNHNINGSLQLPYDVTFTNEVSLSYRPANAAFPQSLNIAQWNSSLGIKMMKDKSLQLKISVNDILDQKVGFNRYVGGNTVSENTYSYIPRYVMVGVNYNLSGNFTTKEKK